MDSNRIKNLATGAREALRAEVSARLDAVLVEGSRERLESASQVSVIEADVREHGRDEVVDRAAYTWFNRLCALRFMDVNGYTPVPVVTPRVGQTQPAILADARRGIFDPEYEISSEVRRQIVALLTGSIPSMNAAEDAYSLLLRAACERYARPMSYLFAEGVASALLMPRSLLAQGSILSRIVFEMDENACSSVEVLGWLYQFYIAERKDKVFDGFRKGRKAGPVEMGPATQLFTPEWIVRYLAENSLGRLWMLNKPESSLIDSMSYYISPASNEPHIEVASAEEIRVLDPACGSGHILVYAFDLLFVMYEEEGWLSEDIPAMILQNNLFGLEIDRRAAEIASFALEMKAREYDSRFFEREVDARITVLDPVVFNSQELRFLGRAEQKQALTESLRLLGEIGSLYRPDPDDASVMKLENASFKDDGSIFAKTASAKLRIVLSYLVVLSMSCHCVITNPPYMTNKNLTPSFSSWLSTQYTDERYDLCTCFVTRGLSFLKEGGYLAEITMQSWMFEASFERFRTSMLKRDSLLSLVHLGIKAFEEVGNDVVQTAAFVIRRDNFSSKATFIKLDDCKDYTKKQSEFFEQGRWYSVDTEGIKRIPGEPLTAYWVPSRLFDAWNECHKIEEFGDYTGSQNVTGDNNRYLRLFWEVSQLTVIPGYWVPYAKGGNFRRYYGNIIHVVDWREPARVFYQTNKSSNMLAEEYWYREGITYSAVTSRGTGFRRLPAGCIFDKGGASILTTSHTDEILALLNSRVASLLFSVLNPSINLQVRDIKTLPIKFTEGDVVANDSKRLQAIAQEDWDEQETSMGFTGDVLVGQGRSLIADAYQARNARLSEARSEVERLMMEIDDSFCSVYGIDGSELPPFEDRDFPVGKPDRVRDARSLVSYGIGCLLGRYSTQAEGLVLADAGSTLDDFREKVPGVTFMPDADNVLPILADEWFDDDVVTGFRAWLAHTFGEATVDENVAWLEESLGRDLRSYLCRNFYSDHLKVYQKRPIYWMFQSPKKSFQCLVYMHRYDEGTVGTILTGYLRPLEDKLRARLVVLDAPGASAADAREANKARGMIAELEQWEREVVYPLAHERVSIDLDDGVKVNYNKFPKALAKVVGLSDWK